MSKYLKDTSIFDYCKGQCGYAPYCAECKKEREKVLKRGFKKRGITEQTVDDDSHGKNCPEWGDLIKVSNRMISIKGILAWLDRREHR